MKHTKNFLFTLFCFFMGMSTVFADNTLTYVKCGEAEAIPGPVPVITSTAYYLLMIGTPIILIIFSIVALVKAITAGKQDEILKAKNKLIKKFVAAAFVFFVAGITQFVITRVAESAESGNISSCLSCILYNSGCEDSQSTWEEVVNSGYHGYVGGSSSSSSSSSGSVNVAPGGFKGKTYQIDDNAASKIAALCVAEEGGSVENVHFYAGFILNLVESGHCTSNSPHTCRWFAPRSRNMAGKVNGPGTYSYNGESYTITQAQIDAVKDVYLNGNRDTHANEHDYYGDIQWIEVNGTRYTDIASFKDKSKFIAGNTIICNNMGSRYIFETYPPAGGDPFGKQVQADNCKKKN